MVIQFGSGLSNPHKDVNIEAVIINKTNQVFEIDEYEVAVFDKGGCGLTVELEDGQTVTLHNSLGAMLNLVFASKVKPVYCREYFSIFVNNELVHLVAKIILSKGVLSFSSGDINFTIDLTLLNFEDAVFRAVIGAESKITPITLESIVQSL
ncbi:hypothetical protein AMD27_16230 (plasmid) [Acinetobacter sp. TGL-Y2]|uniref:hypothetical protein n=1 Tax=Acinetobacter sp. TGL-Y2 TaxID=1407071 RepID=UPI0007A6691B|nr:hypothetical protein [Acinetobacter sp. TGL-Y2]AMW80465.1 hypothetical protein AMD27_16230 [Acinetobacter sp. TGL-Y2]